MAGLLVAAVAGLALTLTHANPRPPASPSVATRAALHDPRVRRALAGVRWDRVETNLLDGRLERVSFWDGGQIEAEVAVDRRGKVAAVADDHSQAVPYGDWIAYEPAVLACLSLVFLLATLVVPWRRMRNLDAAAALSLVISVVLFQHRYVDASLLAAMPSLGYLMVRTAWRGLGPARNAPASTPLLNVLAAGIPPARRKRWLRAALAGLALVFVMVGVSSPVAVDVAYAVMEGATRLTHGVLPYGHMPPGIIHGDTYPILSYALYWPLALIAPVQSIWYSVDGALGLAVTAAVGSAWGVFRVLAGPRKRLTIAGPARPPEQEDAGLRAAIAVLSFPPLLIVASSGTTDVVLAAALVAALLVWRRPAAGSAMLTAAGWFKLAPFALVPVFLAPLRGRRFVAALGAIVLVSMPLIALLIALGGIAGPTAMVRAVSYQFTRGSLQSLWSVLGIGGLQPLAQGAVLGLIAGATLQLSRQPRFAQDRERVAAVLAAILIALQLAADYWAFLYVIWFVPLVCTALFAPGTPGPRALAGVAPAPASSAVEALAA